MDINLSTTIMDNFQGNSSFSTKGIKSQLFESIFSNLQNEEECEDINYDLVLNILNNIQILNPQKEIVEIDINHDKLDIISENTIDLNMDYKMIQNESGYSNNIDDILNIFMDNNIESNNLFDELLGNNEYKLSSDDIDLSDISNKNDNLLDSKFDQNIEETINSSSEIYNELEISSLNNKNTILEKEKSNKDIETLESILNKDNTSNFIVYNNMNFDKDISSTVDIKNQVLTNIRKEYIESDVVKTIKYLSTNGLEEITIKISPKELGDMTIRLIKTEEETNVNIVLSKEDMFEIVSENISDIVQHLDELDINIKDISIDMKKDNQNSFSENLNHEFNKKNQENQKRRNKVEKMIVETIEEIENDKQENLDVLI